MRFQLLRAKPVWHREKLPIINTFEKEIVYGICSGEHLSWWPFLFSILSISTAFISSIKQFCLLSSFTTMPFSNFPNFLLLNHSQPLQPSWHNDLHYFLEILSHSILITSPNNFALSCPSSSFCCCLNGIVEWQQPVRQPHLCRWHIFIYTRCLKVRSFLEGPPLGLWKRRAAPHWELISAFSTSKIVWDYYIYLLLYMVKRGWEQI